MSKTYHLEKIYKGESRRKVSRTYYLKDLARWKSIRNVSRTYYPTLQIGRVGGR